MKKLYPIILCIGMLLVLSFPTYADENCLVEPMNEDIITPESGQLLYIPASSRELWRVGSRIRDESSYYQGITISPDGSRVAWIELVVNRRVPITSNLIVHEISTGNETTIELFADLSVLPHFLQWIGNSAILTIYIPNVTEGIDFLPFSLIDIESLETSYVFPPYTFQPKQEGYRLQSNPLLTYSNTYFSGLPEFSPNGQFVKDRIYNRPILYDIYNRQVLELDNLRGSIWSPDSQMLFDLDLELDEDRNHSYDLYQYDIAQDSSQHIYSFGNIGREDFTTDDDGLSVTGLLALGHRFRVEREEFPKIDEQLEIMDIATGELSVTCFFTRPRGESSTRIFDFEWSLDGRYLAFFGAEREEQAGSVFIYDTQTKIAYEVYSDDADIVGWTTLSNQDR